MLSHLALTRETAFRARVRSCRGRDLAIESEAELGGRVEHQVGAALQRMLPRLGLAVNAAPPEVVAAVAERAIARPEAVHHILFGPPPSSDDDLLNLARELDDIERQVANS